MLPEPRPYQDERDLARMYALLEVGRAAQTGSYYVHTGDLKWWLYYPPLGGSWWEHIYLWEDKAGGDRLLGFALIDPHGETFDVFYQPEINGSAQAEAMLDWAEAALLPCARANGNKEMGRFWVTPEDSFRASWLEARGYRITYKDAALSRPLSTDIPGFSIPMGFEVRPCHGLEEVEARARAQYGAFRSSAPFERYVQRFRRFMQSPAYSPAADMVAAAPDGRIAAFCITWTNETNRIGLFEPVGTHPDFQRLGLGKAVMLAALRRLQAHGMQQAIVCTRADNAPALGLYASVGFQPFSTFSLYAKALE